MVKALLGWTRVIKTAIMALAALFLVMPTGAIQDQPHYIYAIGDSLTRSAVPPGSNNVNYYPSRLAVDLGGSWVVFNGGVNGDTTAGVLSRIYTDVLPHPGIQYVIVWVGTNDVLQGLDAPIIESNLQSIYSALHAANINVVALNLSPFGNYQGWTPGRQFIQDEVNHWIGNQAQDVSTTIDVRSVLASGNALAADYDSGDGIHLNAAGYQAVGDRVYSAVLWPGMGQANRITLFDSTNMPNSYTTLVHTKATGPNVRSQAIMENDAGHMLMLGISGTNYLEQDYGGQGQDSAYIVSQGTGHPMVIGTYDDQPVYIMSGNVVRAVIDATGIHAP